MRHWAVVLLHFRGSIRDLDIGGNCQSQKSCNFDHFFCFQTSGSSGAVPRGGEVDLARCCERRGAWQHGVAQVRRCGVRPLWRHREVRGAVEAVFRFGCQNGQIAKSFQNFIGKTHLKKIFLDGAGTAKYFIKLCLFAKQPVATKEEMTRGSV